MVTQEPSEQQREQAQAMLERWMERASTDSLHRVIGNLVLWGEELIP